jgi:outer membrane immunogenic protein
MRAKLKLASAVAAIALLGAIPVHAADVISEVPEPGLPMEEPPVASWAGAYAGVALGYGFAGETTGAAGGDIETDGFLGHGFAGYNWQSDFFVYGFEADLGYAGLSGSNGLTTSRSGLDGSLRARMGVAVSDGIMIYGTAGGAGQNVRITDPAGSDRNMMLGWTAGGGAEVKLTDNIFGRVEYRYTDYGNKTFNTGSGAQNISASDNRVSFGLGMRF